ncbi:MAG: zinc ribbon domain-containing protein [Acidobacteriota bacterium]|nr:zinc ribbon domain-containing protein [Acidobacteriota bacterium]
MYCPSCANLIDGSQKFCRSCGANVSMVPQAMTGQLPNMPAEELKLDRHGKRRKPPTIERAAGKFFSGLGFVIAALFITFWFPGGFTWGWSFLFPAFALIGEGVGQYLKVKELERQRQPLFNPPQINYHAVPTPQNRAGDMAAPTTSELINPSSVTEPTTRHLELKR